MTITLSFEIELNSNYHVGAGQRGGSTVDAILLRGHDGAPVLRGSMLAGLLKEGLRELQRIAPQHIQHSEWGMSADENLFGSPENPKRWCYSTARPVASATEKQWGSAEVTRVRVNPRTRRVSPQKLFTQEEGDERLVFHFTASCEGATARDSADALLLIAAARSVRYLGAARRRGRGDCRFKLTGVTGLKDVTDQASALQQFKAVWLADKPLPVAQAAKSQPLATRNGQRVRVRVVAYAAEPLLISRHSEVGNAFETRSDIPGTTLLGALATRAARRLGLRYASQTPAEFADLFVRGGVQVTGLLPATLDPDDGETLYPNIVTPRSLVQCESFRAFSKDDIKHPSYNSLTDNSPDSCPELENGNTCAGKIKPVGGLLQLRRDLTLGEVRKREEPHIKIKPDQQRVDETGGLYEYIALDAGQWFVGELSCEAAWWERFQALTGLEIGRKCTLRVGKATRRGYGLLHLALETAQDTWVRLPFQQRVTSLSDPLSLLLLTDTILPDRWQRFERSLSATTLTDALAVDGVSVRVTEQFASSTPVDNFNTHRRLPRWRDVAIEAGTVAQIELVGVTDGNAAAVQAALQRMETDGIGWRRREGFGRIAFNHPVFQPSMLPTRGVMSDETLDLLEPQGRKHTLQKLDEFAAEWDKKLNDPQFDDVNADYEPLARLIYLHRHKPLDDLLHWLSKDDKGMRFGRSDQLWGDKAFPNRSKDSRIKETFINWLHKLLQTELTDKSAAERARALEMVADKIATRAKIARQNKGDK